MKKLTSLEDLKSLIPKDYKSENIIKPKSNIKKQTLRGALLCKRKSWHSSNYFKRLFRFKKRRFKKPC